MRKFIMYQFHVPNMSCNGCLRNITNAIHQIDDEATTEADFQNRTLKVHTEMTEAEVINVITDAGYPAKI